MIIASVGTADALASYAGSYPSTIEDVDLEEAHDSSGQRKEYRGKSEFQADLSRRKSRAN
jgi:hypothetical protein